MKLVGQPYSSKQTFCLDFLLKVPLFLTTEGLMEDFPGGSVVKNSPANTGDVGLIPGPGKSHSPRSN